MGNSYTIEVWGTVFDQALQGAALHNPLAYQLSLRLEALLDDEAGSFAVDFVLARLSQGRIPTSSGPCLSLALLLQLERLVAKVKLLHEAQGQQQQLNDMFLDERIAKVVLKVRELHDAESETVLEQLHHLQESRLAAASGQASQPSGSLFSFGHVGKRIS